MEDAAIIQLYFDRNEQALKETSDKYGSYCYTIANNILEDREDVDECLNDTYMKTWNSIPPQRPEILRSWLGKITRNISIDRYRHNTRAKRGGDNIAVVLDELKECISTKSNSVHEEYENKEIAQVINTFLIRQSFKNRVLFVRRYFYGDTISDLSERFGLSESTIKSSLFRTRKSLRIFLEKEEIAI